MFRIAICDDDRDFIFYLKKRITAVLGESSETEFFEYHSGPQSFGSLSQKHNVKIKKSAEYASADFIMLLFLFYYISQRTGIII